MEFVQARLYRRGRTKSVRLIVVHETISPEMGNGAEAVARYFASAAARGSTQRVSDSNSTVMCVRDADTCAGAIGANSDGLHMELVGPGNQSEQDWHDPFSTATVIQAGESFREWSREYDIPARWLTVTEVADGKTKGFCTHNDVTHAFPPGSGHHDPENFPKEWAMGLWFPVAPPTPDPEVPQEDTMVFIRRSTPIHRLLVVEGDWFMSEDSGFGKVDGSDCIELDESAWKAITSKYPPIKI